MSIENKYNQVRLTNFERFPLKYSPYRSLGLIRNVNYLLLKDVTPNYS